MAVSADGRIALSAAGKLGGGSRLAGRDWRLVKLWNGELIGKKVKIGHLFHHGIKKGKVRPLVTMSLTANVAGEAKVSSLSLSLT
ncbi:hypothetical protein Acr_29g0012270 [Actinidia rufa]|uniref:Uncharacterized protein n=1 Tax=Actinidia rufa TaxID=165716 RepID=A0A7J0HG98_9ERIC|nr:hypothetical protein Acr_29g0012270 [Actinidia rufa]